MAVFRVHFYAGLRCRHCGSELASDGLLWVAAASAELAREAARPALFAAALGTLCVGFSNVDPHTGRVEVVLERYVVRELPAAGSADLPTTGGEEHHQ